MSCTEAVKLPEGTQVLGSCLRHSDPTEWPSPSEVFGGSSPLKLIKKELLSCGDGWVQHGPTVALAAKQKFLSCLRRKPDLLLQTGIGGNFRDVNLYYIYMYIYTHNYIGESKNGSVEHCQKHSPLRSSQDVLRVGGRGRPERIFTGRETTRFLGASPMDGDHTQILW